ncbi:SdrD B-like domain-containing protein [Humisphaera borealis]|uniref:SD-repeat containing protein B domain-containing protein n=1 Tax=Humisphaera borealis TaxID=2807512 RepID=A0A7M2WVU1_9BACT|nr:SdrD B-like domain-containing protein [Humisphaera borealis]QOV88600.1 hypothetical protein IPV69_20515 [Humisphaera borealis]
MIPFASTRVEALLITAVIESLETRRLYSTYDIVGVQAASMDQPQVHAIFRNSATGNPLGGTGPNDGTAVKGFLDTGASGILLSQETADGLGIGHATVNGQPVTFADIGVAGSEEFDVSTVLYGAAAPVRSLFDGDLPVSEFDQPFGPIRAQINRSPADFLTGPLDIIGMPAMQGKVVVMDPTPLNQTDISLLDGMRTFLYSPGTPYSAATKATDPGIPSVNRHVKMSYGSFGRFTQVTPAGAPGPTISNNPFIGPNPTRAAGVVDTTPAVQLTEGTRSASGSFLLDTGAAASFVSQGIASKLGVHYAPGTYGSDTPRLLDANNNPVANQFTIPIGGIGGTVNAAGFFADSLTLPTIEGEGIRFVNAPLLVLDVTVADPVTGQTLTLDGDFGMNFLVASFAVDGTTLGASSAGAFDWITFDQPNGVLGLNIPGAGPVSPPPVPPPPPVTATITGTLYEDLNANKSRDANEPALSGRTVYLDVDGSGTLTAADKTTTTAAGGSYSFTGLAAGATYRVKQVIPSGWKLGGPATNLYTVTPTAGQTVAGRDFGSFRTATIKGSLFNDANGNGVRESTEVALSGWTAWIDLNGNGVRDTTIDRSATTDAAGNYSFTGLDPATYTVRLVVKTGWRQTPTAGKTLAGTVVSGQALTLTAFSVTQRGAASGFVFNDLNRNGIKDAGEVGLANWRVYNDTNRNGVWNTGEKYVLTSSTGAWSMTDLLAGTAYQIRVTQQTDWVRTSPTVGYYSITPTAGSSVTGKNFGQRK